PHAAGALVSNVDDLLKWNRALHEGRVLGSATYAQMITPVGMAAGAGYGFGVFVETVRASKALWHGGGIPGFKSSLTYLPGPDITVVVLENDDSRADGHTLGRRLAAMALGDPQVESRLPRATLDRWVGTYAKDRLTLRVYFESDILRGQLAGQLPVVLR